MKYRTEFDSIGKIKVPGDKYWGASTQRSNKYFDIGDFLVRPMKVDCQEAIENKFNSNMMQAIFSQTPQLKIPFMDGEISSMDESFIHGCHS